MTEEYSWPRSGSPLSSLPYGPWDPEFDVDDLYACMSARRAKRYGGDSWIYRDPKLKPHTPKRAADGDS